MVKTNSMFVELGTSLPFLELININSDTQDIFHFSSIDQRHLLLMFICAHCPYVKHLENAITELNRDIKDIAQIIAISSNDVENYPLDDPINLKKQAKINNWDFPYLYDKDQIFAKKLKAACTPDFYLFSNLGNKNFSLFYHGQLDSSRPSIDINPSGSCLRLAIKCLMEEKRYPLPQIASLGCNIKWKIGNEPYWYK